MSTTAISGIGAIRIVLVWLSAIISCTIPTTRYMAPRRAHSSPIKRLAPELLTYIFLLSKPSIGDARKVDWYTALEHSPWILGHISRHWRSVALASPALWSFIIIRNTNDDSQPCSLPMLETQLIRSGKSPLDVVVDFENYDSDDYVVREALKALARHSPRWKTLYITAQQLMSLSSLRGRVPLLEKVSVWGREDEGTDDGYSPPRSIDHFTIAPRLRSVEVDAGFPFFDLPWGQLTRYEACGPWGGHISALMYLKNVESCSMMMADELDLEDPYSHHRTVELPKLCQLDLSTERFIHGFEEFWAWPTWLRLPALTELAIPDGLLLDLPRLLQASKCSLNKLHITMGCPAVDALRPVLKSNPDITELLLSLDIYGSHSRDFRQSKVPPLIAFLTLKTHQPDLLPNLESLIIQSPTSDHDEALVRMIASRWKTTGLRSVRAVDITPGLTFKLNILKSEGLSVSIRR
ncbi:hypothetical protein B0H19DRAFT_321235 [Mycena capillaripes]|nr:hypothetical protein B0H19DRAFT_321235 [Mycena capillaripes]